MNTGRRANLLISGSGWTSLYQGPPSVIAFIAGISGSVDLN